MVYPLNAIKMKKLYFYIPALALLAAACQKDNTIPAPGDDNNEPAPAQVEMITETVSGGRGASTKATIADADASFAWTAGDNVAVHVSNGGTHKYVTTSKGADAAGASAKFEVTYEEGYSRDAFAVYPSTIVAPTATNYGQDGHALDVTLPSSYTLAQVQGEVSPCPMIATNTAGAGWNFYQLCGLLRLTVNSIPPSTKRLEISFDGKNVAGNFAIPSPVKGDGTSTIAMGNASGSNSSVITITNSGDTFYSGWGDGKVFNIPLPVGTYSNITITTYDALADGNATLTTTRPFSYTSSNRRGAKLTVSFSVFSVNSARTTRVIFAPGNLQATYNASSKTWNWHFAEHQYDFIGDAGGNKLIATSTKEATEPYAKLFADGTVDLFGWSSNATYYGIASSKESWNPSPNDYTGDFVDWGRMDIDGKGANYWRTMSCRLDNGFEWFDLLSSRSGTTINNVDNARFTLAAINTDGTRVNGMILFPDYYSGPTSSSSDITFGRINEGRYIDSSWPDWGGTSCTIAGWAVLESAGCVFLPAAGERKGTDVDFSFNGYASKTNNGEWGWYPMRFRSGTNQYNVYWNGTHYRYTGVSVRLVHEIN